ncbi:hypothetical protein GCM10011375_38580 [Hymenobacter qilianensis]|uniref:Uncharacterized protein n=2 Tax=Hymenobacter qilianensis TaxID=1385715 RepID=A0ACB5PWV0_9BACT|nr:alpha/beta fold hydrolase [Hymenobacter qilianensis]QNP54259.1 alpha/beta fold hydrolase [Hymenobacter qilianensis]GGF79819.1 hypothetical protein GCM10011375_38580 [Hymenobacter qilianensis]
MPATTLPALVLLHGFLESPAIWPDFLGDAFADYPVLTPALPGYVGPTDQATDYSLEAAADALRATLAAAGVGRGGLIGHSMGGYVALAFAEQYPGLVAGLGLFHSSALPDSEEDMERRLRNRTFMEEHGMAAFAAEFIQPQLSPTHRESLTHHVALLQGLAGAVPLPVALGSLQAMAQRPDRRAVLEKATYPVLFLAGKDDRAVPPEKTHQESLFPDTCTGVGLAGVGCVAQLFIRASRRRGNRLRAGSTDGFFIGCAAARGPVLVAGFRSSLRPPRAAQRPARRGSGHAGGSGPSAQLPVNQQDRGHNARQAQQPSLMKTNPRTHMLLAYVLPPTYPYHPAPCARSTQGVS